MLAPTSAAPRGVDDLTAALAGAAEAACLREIAEGALPRLQRAVGASHALVYRYGEGGAMEALGGSLAGEMDAYARELLERDPLQGPPRRLAPGLKVVAITRHVDRGVYRASDAYNLFYRPHDLEHVTCAWLTGDTRYGEPGMTGILFGRDAHAEPFSDRDVDALAQALPVLAAAVRRSARAEAAEDRRGALEAIADAAVARPVVAVGRSGRVLWMSRGAEALLGAEQALPARLLEAARQLAALASGERSAWSPALSGSFERPGGAVRAELSLTRAPGGEAVVLIELAARDAPGRGLEALAREHRLTRAEAEVLRVLATGRSNREIAAQLHVSVETVRTHVARVLGKLGLETRTQAALRVRERAR